MPSIDDVERSNAGAELFNGITRMRLVREDGYPMRFSERREWTRRVIGQMLESHLLPESFVAELDSR